MTKAQDSEAILSLYWATLGGDPRVAGICFIILGGEGVQIGKVKTH